MAHIYGDRVSKHLPSYLPPHCLCIYGVHGLAAVISVPSLASLPSFMCLDYDLLSLNDKSSIDVLIILLVGGGFDRGVCPHSCCVEEFVHHIGSKDKEVLSRLDADT